MILNCAYINRSCLALKNARITSNRHVWNESSPSKISNKKKKNEKTIRKITCDTVNISHQENSIIPNSVTSQSAVLKSLDMALSECRPYSVKTLSRGFTKSNTEKVKITSQKNKNSIDDSAKKQKSNDNLKVLKSGNGGKAKKEESVGLRLNEVNIQMLPKNIFQHLFGKGTYEKPSETQITMAQEELKKHNLLYAEKPTLDEVNFKLPSLKGGTVESHFHEIGEEQSRPYRILLNNLIKQLPEIPREWLYQPGWTKYSDGQSPQSIPFPDEDALVFDVEVCCSVGEMPTLATAASPNAWYAWISDSLIRGSTGTMGRQYLTKDLIPLESGHLQRGVGHGIAKPRVVVGHNVAFDRTRIKEQYWLESTGMRFVDTMSLHVCVSGITSFQRALLKSNKCKSEDMSSEEEEDWRNYSSLNSLSEVHKLYCGTTLDKTTRDVFVNGTLEDINKQFDTVMHYCAQDVHATHNVLKQLMPLFLSRFPHPVTLAGMLELSTAYLPVNSNWNRYLTDAEQTFQDFDSESRFLLARRADEACQLLHENQYREDLWMWDQDWSTQELKLKKKVVTRRKKQTDEKDGEATKVSNDKEMKVTKDGQEHQNIENESYSNEKEILDSSDESEESDVELLPAKMPHLPGYPAWYRKLCPRPSASDWMPGPQLISTSMQVTPKLLCHGWGFLVPYRNTVDSSDNSTSSQVPVKQLVERCPIIEGVNLTAGTNESELTLSNLHKTVEENISRRAYGKRRMPDTVPTWYKGNGVWCNVDLENCCWFLKLPHKNGSDHKVGNPLAKDFLNKFSENVLAGADAGAEKLLAIGRMLSYWRNNRERIEQQLVVWLDDRDLPRHLRSTDSDYGAIIPQVVVCGTLTRRAVEPTWMTASNTHKERIGSELRAMIQAPPGYSIVGADVDSQELWISSLIGDSYFARIHGATPFGWMTLSGRKADGTDMHSVTAKAVGISRDHAKVINYARIYGAGQQFAERLLKQFNPVMSDVDARSKASKMFALTKGRRKYRLRESYRAFLEDRLYTMTESLKLRSLHGVSLEEMFEHPQWVGGTESAMFNRLEEIANNPEPSTPFLGGRLSRALEPKVGSADQYLPTRVNWVVQSGAVDFLHLMLVSMRWLLDTRAKFCISFHDEVRYLVPEDQKYQAALALHVTNLLARAFCASILGLSDLPLSVAFFASVEVDTALRKEAHNDCTTPSNPHGLSKGYGIPPGESLDIYKALEKAGGSLKATNRRSKKRIMSRFTKRKHVIKEVLLDDLQLLTENQEVVRVLKGRGNNLHEVEGATGSRFLVSMPTKFRRTVWIKRGDFVSVEPIAEGNKVKAEIVQILTK
ncbi:hypothetical protein L9F63_011059 [Diploptera punctata]|uniref:DNA polymerase subunit gamma-1 n=1 Tax=Diploptera punctata TaxID=6984 RepID=A0AAD8AI73_DIPPU|nr:hypothetical protein L9F63_011059 [Diploptera punctata]